MGPMDGLQGCGKPRPVPRSDLRPVQPLASRYTDYAIPAHSTSSSGSSSNSSSSSSISRIIIMRHQYRKERTIQRKPEIPSRRVQDCYVF
jgi:hypothetical protein